MVLKGNVTLVVNTCDSYSDLWELFYLALNEYWPNRTITMLYNTELKTELGFSASNCIVHQSQAQHWGGRLIETLDDVETEYVLMVCDDFIIEDHFDEGLLEQALMWMDKNKDISVFYLDDMKLEATRDVTSYDGFELINDKSEFRLNTAPGLWRREDLKLFTGKEDSPWAWEVFGTYRTQKIHREFYQPTNRKIYHFNGAKGGAIYRGKWVEKVVSDKIEKYKLNIDLEKRGVSSPINSEKRSLIWKLQFLWTGYRMVGGDVFKFIVGALKSKI